MQEADWYHYRTWDKVELQQIFILHIKQDLHAYSNTYLVHEKIISSLRDILKVKDMDEGTEWSEASFL